MKKFFSNIWFYVISAIVILIPLSLALWEIWGVVRAVGGGSIVKGIILTPFAVLGGINVFRGFGAVVEMDGEKFGARTKNDWKFTLYWGITILSYFALFYVVGERF